MLEDFATGVPVLVSDRGAPAERVQHEVNGLPVQQESPQARRSALERICQNPALLVKLRQGITPPRTMAIVAQEMQQLYQRLLNR